MKERELRVIENRIAESRKRIKEFDAALDLCSAFRYNKFFNTFKVKEGYQTTHIIKALEIARIACGSNDICSCLRWAHRKNGDIK